MYYIPNRNRHVHAQKCLHCAGIEPATSCVVGEYSHNYTIPAVNMYVCQYVANTLYTCGL
jgi:hypothetical protein